MAAYARAYLDQGGARGASGVRGLLGAHARRAGINRVMLEPEFATWDWAALWVIVEEAGGRVTTFEGERLSHGSSVLTTNGVLHDEIVARLDARRPSCRGPGGGVRGRVARRTIRSEREAAPAGRAVRSRGWIPRR